MTTNTKQPHIHADVIHAWADGAQIQYREGPTDPAGWEDTATPSFAPLSEYRVKPDNAVKKYRVIITIEGPFITKEEAEIVREEVVGAIEDGKEGGYFGAASPDVGPLEEAP